MIERFHDCDFASHVESKFIRLDIRLIQDLNSIFDASFLMLSKFDLSERALSKGGRDDILRERHVRKMQPRTQGNATQRTGPTREPMTTPVYADGREDVAVVAVVVAAAVVDVVYN